MSRRRKLTRAEHAATRDVVAALEPDPPRPTLWQRMAHQQGTCDSACPLCALGTTVPKDGAA
jgi:hypothetical protein